MELKLIINGKETALTGMDRRSITKNGGSLVIAIPTEILRDAGAKAQDRVQIYRNGSSIIVIDLKPGDR